MKIKRSILVPTVVALLALATGGWFLQQGVSRERNVYLQARLFEEVLHHVSDRFVEEKQPSDLYRMAIDGLLNELGDPHSVFMTPEEYSQLEVTTRGEYGGLGIQIALRDGWVTVIAPLPSTPAERAGLLPGDRIVEVDGVTTRGWNETEAVTKLRGPKGAPVDLRILRVGVEQLIPFRIVRDEIHVSSVPVAYVMGGGVAYVELRAFSESSTDELRETIARLRTQGMRGLILDLRGNPGGLLDQGVSVSDVFLSRGQLVTEMRGRTPSSNQKFPAMQDDEFPGLPVVVLVGPGSASASEIVAGALQDHDRALLIGETSFGKGSVQTLYKLPGGHFLKLTTARWYTPSGRSIHKPYGIDGEPASADLRAGSASRDSAQVYHTDSGRKVLGGGGITPDVILPRDTAISPEEREFARAMQQHGSKFRDALYTYAIRYGKQHSELKPGFVVVPEMLDGFYRALGEHGIQIERRLYDGAGRLVSRELGFEISYGKWGEQSARKRVLGEDPQIRLAQELLRQASDPRSLFAASAAYLAEQAGKEAARAQATARRQ